MSISKDTLMAYVDGELDEATRMEVEAAMTLDPDIMHEVDRQQMLRGRLQGAFDGVLKEPVPDRLIEAVRGAPAPAHRATVTELSQARAAVREEPARSWGAPHWAGMAAALALGLFLGRQHWDVPDTASFTSKNGQLTARGMLAQALTARLSGEKSDTDAIEVVMSFQNEAGRYCRAFVIEEGQSLAGLACREQDAWQVRILEQTQPAAKGDNYRMAASELPAGVLQAAEAGIAGEAFDAAKEVAARERRWQ